MACSVRGTPRCLALASLVIVLWGTQACGQPVSPPQPVTTDTPTAPRAGVSTAAGTSLIRESTVTMALPTSTLPASAGEIMTITPTATSSHTPTTTWTATDTDTPLPPTPTPAPSLTFTPSATPIPPVTSTPTPAVMVRETQVSIPTYPYASYLVTEWAAEFGIPFQRLDWSAYEAAGPTPAPFPYRAIVLENEWLQLTILPELGGRVYRCVFKPTGHNVLYNNPVIKPTRWGPPEQGWWLAAGGIEFCLPTEEHGYESAMPWITQLHRDKDSVTVRVADAQARGRLRATVMITLRAGEAGFHLVFRLENDADHDMKVKYWTNAMIALGGQNRVSEGTQFCFPGNQVIVHSTGDSSLPGPGQILDWPIWQGRDLSFPAHWRGWLGFFAWPRAAHGFAGVYDHTADEGLARIFPPEMAAGLKGFGFGPPAHALPASLWTDNDSTYVELHGGLAPTFDDAYVLPATGSVSWDEFWYPVAGLGGLTLAGPSGAGHVTWNAGQHELSLRIMPTRRLIGQIEVSVNGQSVASWSVQADAGQIVEWPIPFSMEPAYGSPIELTFTSGQDTIERWEGPYRPLP